MQPIFHLRHNPPPLLTLGEAVRIAEVPRDIVHDAVLREELPSATYEGRRFVRPADLIAWLRLRKSPIAEGIGK